MSILQLIRYPDDAPGDPIMRYLRKQQRERRIRIAIQLISSLVAIGVAWWLS